MVTASELGRLEGKVIEAIFFDTNQRKMEIVLSGGHSMDGEKNLVIKAMRDDHPDAPWTYLEVSVW